MEYQEKVIYSSDTLKYSRIKAQLHNSNKTVLIGKAESPTTVSYVLPTKDPKNCKNLYFQMVDTVIKEKDVDRTDSRVIEEYGFEELIITYVKKGNITFNLEYEYGHETIYIRAYSYETNIAFASNYCRQLAIELTDRFLSDEPSEDEHSKT